MNMSHIISVIDTHAAGEPIRILHSGLPMLRGNNISEKMENMRNQFDWIRTSTICEPRGHRGMVGAVLVEPAVTEADIGVFYFDLLNYAPMCGAGALAVAKTLVEIGRVNVTEPVTKVIMDTPSGLVNAFVVVENNKVGEVTLENVPSFISDSGIALTVPGIGQVTVDVAYGGNFFVFVDVEPLALSIESNKINFLVDAGMKILKTAREIITVNHPLYLDVNLLNDMMFCQKPDSNNVYKGMVVFGDSQFDRSPCGTGTCARMARLYTKGELQIGQQFIHKSVFGTTFTGVLQREEMVGPIQGVVPRITGNAYITGFNSLVIDPDDSLKNGFWI